MPAIRGAVVVIVGASSGIGRAAAQLFARHGAHLVLASRRADTLAPVVAECERLGATAIAVPTDVTDAEAVGRLADAAVARFGRVDVWINNAGIGAIGQIEDVPIASHEQVIRTNLLGTLYGAHAVVPIFKRQGAGVMINTLSITSWLPAAFGVSYGASKFGLRGLSDSLRTELAGFPGIHVCAVYPGLVDTPGLRHGANYTGRAIEVGGLISSPFAIAEAIVDLARHPRPEATIGLGAWLMRGLQLLAPGVVRRGAARFMQAGFDRAPRAPRSEGNLFEASDNHAVYGGFAREPALPRIPKGVWMAVAGIVAFAVARRR